MMPTMGGCPLVVDERRLHRATEYSSKPVPLSMGSGFLLSAVTEIDAFPADHRDR